MKLRHYVTAFVVTGLLSGCAGYMEKFGGPPQWPYDKVRVYPRDVLEVPAREIDKYRCVVGVLYCETLGGRSRCECVSME